MFCPNCGRKCADGKFCPSYGTKQPRDAEAWFAGMPCPRCGSRNIQERNTAALNWYLAARGMVSLFSVLYQFLMNKIEAGEPTYLCPDCGYQWNQKTEFLRAEHTAIYRRYLGNYPQVSIGAPKGACLQVTEAEVQLQNADGKAVCVPFHTLAAVRFQGSMGPLHGWLSIRDTAHCKKPFPRSFKEAEKDKWTILCSFENESSYKLLYRMLAEIAQRNCHADFT